jgi:hypothetical protein
MTLVSASASISNSPNSPILVAGAHRTGTTWVGKMLCASGEAAYISEPLNVWHRPGVMRASTPKWYTYICTKNQGEYRSALQETIRFRYHLLPEIRSLRSGKDILRMGRDLSIFMGGRISRKRALVKDPFAVFSAPWFVEELGCRVVITVRHPVAFASSLKRLNWTFDFKDLLSQPLLMQDWLEPYRKEMEYFSEQPQDIVRQASLLWRLIYQVVWQYRQVKPEIIVVRHEDLSVDPIKGFQALYASLGLHFTPRVVKTILESSSSENPKELSRKSTYSVRLDSQANLRNWMKRLEPQEIQCIRQLTDDVTALYYPDQSWD